LRAISQYRRYYKHYVWADATCINQSNLEERNEQVKCMQLIFRNASEVVVGLGHPPSQKEQRLLHALKRMRQEDANGYGGGAINHSREPRRDIQHVSAILEFLQRDWFSRLWTRVEFINARAITYVFEDGMAVAGQDIELLFSDALAAHSAQATDTLNSSLAFTRASCMWGLAQLKRSGQPLPAHQLLYATRFYACVDSRDRLFALYSVDSAELAPSNIVDYTASVASVVNKFNHFIGSRHGVLGLLAEAVDNDDDDARSSASSEDSMAMWSVPFYDSPSPRTRDTSTWASVAAHPIPETFIPLVFKDLHTIDESDFVAGGDHERKVALHPGSLLEMRGKSLAYIGQASESMSRGDIEPEIVQRYGMGRKLMRRVDDEVVLGPGRAQEGDQIFVFAGFRVPYVLRKQPSGLYTYVGEANVFNLWTFCSTDQLTPSFFRYVPGCMYGESLASEEDMAQLGPIYIL